MVRPQCILLDAGPVIFLHERGAWLRFCEVFEVVIPEIVADDEALFHSRDELTGAARAIDVRAEQAAGRVTVVAATASEFGVLLSRFSDDFAMGLHEGELEGLALLTERESLDECVFCTGDGAAIQAAMMRGLSERCLPLEDLLGSSGLKQPVPNQLSRRFFETHQRMGLDNRMTGLGMRRRD